MAVPGGFVGETGFQAALNTIKTINQHINAGQGIRAPHRSPVKIPMDAIDVDGSEGGDLRNVVLAIQKNGRTLEHASDELKNDRAVVPRPKFIVENAFFLSYITFASLQS
jgi:hypothetical protein